METKGIPVVTVGQDEFPSFYSRQSSFRSPLRVDTPDEIAALLHTKWNLGLNGAVLVANPVPANQEVPAAEIESCIHQALESAKKQHIRGKALTPFLLRYISEHTKGESLQANIALIRHNAQLGAEIANAFANISKKEIV